MTPPPSDDSPTIGGDPTISDAPTIGDSAATGVDGGGYTPVRGPGPLQPNMPFGSRYRILRELGAGGMGVVYQAWDEELGVAVALKIIRPEVTSDPYVARDVERRFKRELLLAREVTHSNVVRIHDLGEIDGIKYITMSYVDGMDLATVIKREVRLPVDRALRIIRGVVSGLRAAHHAGVVHRDLKPANIMIGAQDQALIMDFGIARSTSRPAGPHAQPADGEAKLFELRQQAALLSAQTMQGAVVGTVEYMAPEQAKGEEVDQRADIYALGLILYDMLGGAGRASRSESALVELTGRMQQGPPSIRSINPDIPEPLARVIARCLEPAANARYASTKELDADLQRLDDQGRLLPVLRRVSTRQLAGAAVLTLALLTGTWWFAQTPPAPPEQEPVSVLVVDFDNRTGDPVFQGSIEQALTIGLEGASFITAYPRRNAVRLAEQLKPGSALDESMARLISTREGIKVILTGSVAPRGRGFEISVRALDPALDPTQSQPLAEVTSSAATKPEVLTAVTTLASRIRSALGDTTSESARLAAAETFTAGSLEAMRAYARGQELAIANKIPEALKAYEEAVSLDPRFGRAYAGMAVIYSNRGQEEKANASWQQALKNVDRMTEREKYRTFGNYYQRVARNYEQAAESFEDLVERYPADDGGHGNLALAYLYLGRIPDAVAEVRKSLAIYPKNSLQRHNYAMYSMFAGDYPTALAEGERVLKENPSFAYWTLIPIAVSHLAQGDANAAREAYARLERLSPEGKSLANRGVADLEMYFGRHKAALGILRAGIAADEKLENSLDAAQKYVAAAEAYLALGERMRARQAAAKAVTLSRNESILFPAARAMLEAGQENQAEKIAAELENMLQRQTTAYGRTLTGELAVRRGQLAAGIEAFRDAQKRHDSWFVRFLLGKTYAEAGHHAEALRELELCIKRRGETTGVFSYDPPTLRYLPPTYYWLARAQQGVGAVSEARKNYEAFLKLRADADPPDALATDARQRLASLSGS